MASHRGRRSSGRPMRAVLGPSVLLLYAEAHVAFPRAPPPPSGISTLAACATPECVFHHVAQRIQQHHDGSPSGPVIGLSIGSSDRVIDLRPEAKKSPVARGASASTDVKVAVACVSDLLALLEQRLSPARAVMQRRLRLSGDISSLRHVRWLLYEAETETGLARRSPPHRGRALLAAATAQARRVCWRAVLIRMPTAMVARLQGRRSFSRRGLHVRIGRAARVLLRGAAEAARRALPVVRIAKMRHDRHGFGDRPS